MLDSPPESTIGSNSVPRKRFVVRKRTEYTRLGKTGMKVSRLYLGTISHGSTDWREWALDEAAARPYFEQPLKAEINFFDTADVYSNGACEEIVGGALAIAKEMSLRLSGSLYTDRWKPS